MTAGTAAGVVVGVGCLAVGFRDAVVDDIGALSVGRDADSCDDVDVEAEATRGGICDAILK